MVKHSSFEDFVAGYLACAQWADAPEDSCARFTKAALLQAAADCREFIEACGPLIEQAAELRNWNSLGHDFWLTRCGHGSGFWDRDELCEVAPCATVYGVARWNAGCYALDPDDLACALAEIAYGTNARISRFAYAELTAYRGWLSFN